MSRFMFRAYTHAGDVISDAVDAPSEADAVKALLKQGLTPFEIAPDIGGKRVSSQSARAARATTPGLAAFCRALSAMLAGGVPLDEALKMVAQDRSEKRAATLASEVHEGVISGRSLAEALADVRAPPANYVLGLVRAGEEGGSLVPVLSRLSVALENEMRLANAVRGALVYPVILMLTALVSIGVILMVVAPALKPVLQSNAEAAPMAASLLIAASDALRASWVWLSLGLLSVVLIVLVWSRNTQGRRTMARLALSLPVIGDLVRDIECARCLASLSALLENGMSLVPALGVARQGAGNPLVAESVDRIEGQVRTGVRLSQAMAGDDVFPLTASQFAIVGERSGDMPGQLARAAALLEERSRREIDNLTTVAGPALTLALGLLIGGIVLTLLSAIMSVNDLAI